MRRTDAGQEAWAEEAVVEAWKRQRLRTSYCLAEVTAGRSHTQAFLMNFTAAAALAEIKAQLPLCDRYEIQTQ